MKMLFQPRRSRVTPGPEREAASAPFSRSPAPPTQRAERRSGSKKQKEAAFFDHTQQRRMWLALASSILLNLAQTLVIIVLIVVLSWLTLVATKTKTVGLIEHDDGRPTTVVGELQPLHGDATLTLLQTNAMHYIDLLFTNADFQTDEGNKTLLLMRTAGGSQAETFVNSTFTAHFASIRRHLHVGHIDCRNEGFWKGPTSSMRFDCYYTVGPVLTLASNDPADLPVRFESHIEIAQSRGPRDPSFYYSNPDEVFVSYVDQQAL